MKIMNFFFTETATPEIYTLSLHDALPISAFVRARVEAAGRLARLVLKALDEGEAGDPTAQAGGLILRPCVLPRVMHLFRGHYARSLLPLASDCDAMMRMTAARRWLTSPNWGRPRDLQFPLPRSEEPPVWKGCRSRAPPST